MSESTVNEVDAWRDVPPPGDDDAPWAVDSAGPIGRDEMPSPSKPTPLFNGPPQRGLIPDDPPPFPVDALPAWLADWVRAVADATAASADIAAQVSLGVASWAAVWSPRETPLRVEWAPGIMSQPLVLFCVAVEKSAANKSGVFRSAVAPVRELEREIIAEKAGERATMNSAHINATTRVDAFKAALATAHKAKATGKTVKGDPPEVIAEALEDALVELAEHSEATVPIVIIDDATPEALVRSLASVPVAIVAMPEGHDFFELATGRYGKGANFGAVLKAYDAEDHRVTRIGRADMDLEAPLMAMATTTQPVTLSRLGSMSGDTDERGLIGRIVWAWPQSVLGTRSPPSTSRSVPPAVRDAYHRGIRDLWRAAPAKNGDGHVVPILPDAAAVALADSYYLATEARIPEWGDLSEYSSMVGKSRGVLMRIAAILHLADGYSPSEAVSTEVMRRALRLTKYYVAHGLRVWRVMREGEEPHTSKVWRILRRRAQAVPDAEITFAQ